MYPLRLNLLTEEKKIRTAQFKFVQTIFQTILLTISLTAMALLASENLLQKYFTSIAQSTLVVSNKYASAAKEIENVNKLTKKVNDIQSKYHEVIPIVLSLSTSVPQGVQLNSLEIDYLNKTIRFSGISDTRQNFLDFQELLKKNEMITDLEAPVSDLTKKENIVFNLSVNIK